MIFYLSNKITKETIEHYFKKGGIILKKDGKAEFILIEDLSELKNKNIFLILLF